MFTENQPLTISPITTAENGSYTWEINGQTYWTNTAGQGIFTSTYSETTNTLSQTWMHGGHNKQLAGTGQFSLAGLSTTARRARVITYFVKNREGYREWLYREGLDHSQEQAMTYYQTHKA